MSAPSPALAPCQQNEHQSFRWMLTIELLMLCSTFLVAFITFWNTCSSDSYCHRISFTNIVSYTARVLFTNFLANFTNYFANFLRSSTPLRSLILRSCSLTFWNTNSSDSYSHRVLRSFTNFLTNILRPPRCVLVLLLLPFPTIISGALVVYVLFISLGRLFILIANSPRAYGVILFYRSIISKLSIPIITYILTAAAAAASPLFILSVIFLHLLFKTINPNKNNELEERKHFPIEQVADLCWIIFVLITSGSKRNIPWELKLPTYVILGLSVCKVILRYVALRRASQSFAMGKNAKLVASYMTHNLPPETEQPVSEVEYSEAPIEFMSEYKYLVMGEEKQKIEPSKEGNVGKFVVERIDWCIQVYNPPMNTINRSGFFHVKQAKSKPQKY